MLRAESLSLSSHYDNFHSEVNERMNTPLSLCHEGDTVIIQKVHGNGGFKKRLIELGLRKGKVISVVRYAPLRDPMEICIDSCHISLRVEEAEKIDVTANLNTAADLNNSHE